MTTRLRGVLVPLTLLAAPLPLLLLGCGGTSTAPAATQTPHPAPAVLITGTTAAAVANAVTLTFTFSEPVATFPASAVTVLNGTAATTTMVSANQWTLVVTPPANATGTMTITVSAGAVTDTAGVANTVAASVTQTYNTVVVVAPASKSVFADAYATGVAYVPFGGSTGAPVVDTAVAHGGTASLRFDVPATNYVGGALVSSTPVDLSSYTALTFWIKASATNVVDVAGFGNDANGNTTFSAESAAIPVTTSWTKYIIPVPRPAVNTAATGLAHFTKGSENGAFSFWVDDVQYEQLTNIQVGAPTAVTVTWPSIPTLAIGGTFLIPSGPNTVAYALPALATGELTNVGFGYFTWTTAPTGIVTVSKAGLVTGTAVGATTLTAALGPLAVTGSAPVTVTAGLSAPAAGANPPALPAASVISLFNSSATYTNIALGNWNPNWGQGGSIAPATVGTANVLLMNLINYQGIDISGPNGNSTDTAPNPISIAGKQHLHLSYWTAGGTSFTFTPIDANDNENQMTSGNLAQGAWTDLEFDCGYTGFDLTTVRQLKFVTTAAENIYLDNIYFH